VHRRDEVDVVRAFLLKLKENLREALDGDLRAGFPAADLPVLAKDAAQRAPGKEDGARAGFAAEKRLLPKMERRPADFRQDPGPAETRLAVFSVDPAPARAERAPLRQFHDPASFQREYKGNITQTTPSGNAFCGGGTGILT